MAEPLHVIPAQAGIQSSLLVLRLAEPPLVIPAQAGIQITVKNFPGGRPGAGYFRLRGQKKVAKENAALVRRHCGGDPVLLAKAGPVELALDK